MGGYARAKGQGRGRRACVRIDVKGTTAELRELTRDEGLEEGCWALMSGLGWGGMYWSQQEGGLGKVERKKGSDSPSSWVRFVLAFRHLA